VPGLVAFLTALEEGGRARVPAAPDLELPDPRRDDPSLDERLRALAARVRAGLAHEPPPLSLPAARWGLRVAYVAAQALVHRAIAADVIERELGAPCPAPPSPSTTLSADLALSVLPDLQRLARGLGDGDPLRVALLALARAWPLSSVGMGPLGPLDLSTTSARLEDSAREEIEIPPRRLVGISMILSDPSLRALYVDRILARRDLARLGEPRVDAAVREALGARPDLCPPVARALEGAA
jgi:hypothetical protein